MKVTKYITALALVFTLNAPLLVANDFGISESKLNEIETRVGSMGYKQLIDNRSMLQEEKYDLEESQRIHRTHLLIEKLPIG